MPRNDNCLLLRMWGPLQSWTASPFVIKTTQPAPTRSGVFGVLCAALGLNRNQANEMFQTRAWKNLQMGVRVDRPGSLTVQYNTVTGTQKAEGGVKRNEATDEIGTLEILRTVLSDAKFLVALLDHDDTGLIQTLGKACCKPIFEPVLGSRAFLTFNGKMFLGTSYSNDLTEALTVSPWVGNFNDTPPDKLEAIIECPLGQPLPPDYDLMYDSPRLSTPREFFARAVVRRMIEPAKIVLTPNFNKAFVPVNYKSPRWRNIRAERFALDKECVLCGNLPQVCHHKVYINANNERIEELCSLCILCHIAVTMVEHMTGKNIDPCDANWRPSLEAAKRSILAYYGDPYERSACMAG